MRDSSAQTSEKSTVLILINYYLPGYKAGGPLKSISNLVESLGDRFDFRIITSDRDINESKSYNDLDLDSWVRVGKANVYYISKENQNFLGLIRILSSTSHDVLYLNSFFNLKFSIYPVFARRLKLLPCKPMIIAPRGEFSAGALGIKPLKKKLYLFIARILRLHSEITWHASTNFEESDICSALGTAFGKPRRIVVLTASNLSQPCDDESSIHLPEIAVSNQLKVIFLSRISPKKNLLHALRVLLKVKFELVFHVYGPIEDETYWQSCLELISLMPPNISVKYCGSVPSKDVKHTFSQYDLFFFPTCGENFGHVIAESLSVGTPVLLSDQTPWRNLTVDQLGWDHPLYDDSLFIESLDSCFNMSWESRAKWRRHIISKIKVRLDSSSNVEANISLFENALSRRFNES